jgi:hypothetical protein
VTGSCSADFTTRSLDTRRRTDSTGGGPRSGAPLPDAPLC